MLINNKKETDKIQIEDKIQIADAMSLSLLFSLGRQYLDKSFDKANYIQPTSPLAETLKAPHLLKLEQVGGITPSSLAQPLIALQTALSACHDPTNYTLIFIVSSNGIENNVYLGVRAHNDSAQPYAFIDYLGNFFRGNWPGTKLVRCDYHNEIKAKLLQPISSSLPFASALTGIPSLKSSDTHGYPQSLDRLLRGLRGCPYMYIVIAEPMAESNVNQVVHRCRDLIGWVHTLAKTNINRTQTSGTTTNETVSKTDQYSQSYSESNTIGSNKSLGFDIKAVAGGILQYFPPTSLISALGLFGSVLLGPNFNLTKERSKTTSKSSTTGRSVGVSETTGLSLSTAQSLGEEYINAHAHAAEHLLQQYIGRFEQARALGCWNVGVYLLSENMETTQQGAAQLRALLSGEKSAFEPIRVHNLDRVWGLGAQAALSKLKKPDLALVNPEHPQQLLEHPLGEAFNSLTTPLNTEELSLLVNLPRREVPGLKLMLSADFSLNAPVVKEQAIELGVFLEGGEPTSISYNISPDTLTKHALVAGITGSGKSTTCRRLLNELSQKKIPFLIVEPAKDEYVEWAMQHNSQLPSGSQESISIYIPGAQTWRNQKLDKELKLNPLEVVWLSETASPNVLSHIDRFKSIFNATFPMQEVLPILLEDVLFYTYKQPFDWLADIPPKFGTAYPTLTQFLNHIRLVVKGKGYEDRITANLTAALITRTESLRRSWKGRLFDQPKSTPWSELFDKPCVINLSYLGDDADKAFAMAILLQFLYEYRQAQQELLINETARNNYLRHLTIVEEAHRILLRTSLGTLEQANPQAKVAEMFSNVLSEIRAYGEGLMIVDQVPSRLVVDAIKNTNLKIIHRLVASDDRDAMASCMTLTSDQAALINRLRQGQAIVYGDQDEMAAWVQILRT